MPCIYQCINGQGVLLSDDCPAGNCPTNGGACYLPDDVYATKCPRPYSQTLDESQPPEKTDED